MTCDYYWNNIKSNDGTSILNGKVSFASTFRLGIVSREKREKLCSLEKAFSRKATSRRRNEIFPSKKKKETRLKVKEKEKHTHKAQMIKNLWPGRGRGISNLSTFTTALRLSKVSFSFVGIDFLIFFSSVCFSLYTYFKKVPERKLPLESPHSPRFNANFRWNVARARFVTPVQGNFCLFLFRLIKCVHQAFHFHFKHRSHFETLLRANGRRKWV